MSICPSTWVKDVWTFAISPCHRKTKNTRLFASIRLIFRGTSPLQKRDGPLIYLKCPCGLLSGLRGSIYGGRPPHCEMGEECEDTVDLLRSASQSDPGPPGPDGCPARHLFSSGFPYQAVVSDHSVHREKEEEVVVFFVLWTKSCCNSCIVLLITNNYKKPGRWVLRFKTIVQLYLSYEQQCVLPVSLYYCLLKNNLWLQGKFTLEVLQPLAINLWCLGWKTWETKNC